MTLYVPVHRDGADASSALTWREATGDEIRAAFFGLDESTQAPTSDVPLPTEGPADATGGGA